MRFEKIDLINDNGNINVEKLKKLARLVATSKEEKLNLSHEPPLDNKHFYDLCVHLLKFRPNKLSLFSDNELKTVTTTHKIRIKVP